MYYIPALVTIPKYIVDIDSSDLIKSFGIIVLGVPINMVLGGLAVYPFLIALPDDQLQLETVHVERVNVRVDDDTNHGEKAKSVGKMISKVVQSFEYFVSVLLILCLISLLVLYCSPPNSNMEYFSLQFTLLFSLVLLYKSFWKLQYKIFEISPFLSILFHPTLATTVVELVLTYLIALMINRSYSDVATMIFSGAKFEFKHIGNYTTIGDILLYFLNVTVMCLSFPIYAKKKQMLSKFTALFGGCLIMAVFNLVTIVAICNALKVTPFVAEVLVFKNIPTPIAVGDASFIGAVPGLCGFVSVLSGIFGAVLFKLYKYMRCRVGVQLGVSIGGSSHLFGMYALSISDSESSAYAFLTFVLIAVYYDFALSYINIRYLLSRA
ncbi:hypothetical protein HDV04_000935 [Boothiomyces sp. JEL0838]|nr:hypothetical protein HDV04_000886 [Boothiomyces sp. JEL0838]KAJ3314212.1 hypothetical protein HDV04_000935 [Boothiomyces sp. JEL0838]